MNIGVSIFDGVDFETQAKYFKKINVERTFINSEMPDFDKVIKLYR